MSDLSIHPRNWPNVIKGVCGSGEKVNTSKPPKDINKGKLGKQIRKLQARRQDRDETIGRIREGEKAYRRPGSMSK